MEQNRRRGSIRLPGEKRVAKQVILHHHDSLQLNVGDPNNESRLSFSDIAQHNSLLRRLSSTAVQRRPSTGNEARLSFSEIAQQNSVLRRLGSSGAQHRPSTGNEARPDFFEVAQQNSVPRRLGSSAEQRRPSSSDWQHVLQRRGSSVAQRRPSSSIGTVNPGGPAFQRQASTSDDGPRRRPSTATAGLDAVAMMAIQRRNRRQSFSMSQAAGPGARRRPSLAEVAGVLAATPPGLDKDMSGTSDHSREGSSSRAQALWGRSMAATVAAARFKTVGASGAGSQPPGTAASDMGARQDNRMESTGSFSLAAGDPSMEASANMPEAVAIGSFEELQAYADLKAAELAAVHAEEAEHLEEILLKEMDDFKAACKRELARFDPGDEADRRAADRLQRVQRSRARRLRAYQARAQQEVARRHAREARKVRRAVARRFDRYALAGDPRLEPDPARRKAARQKAALKLLAFLHSEAFQNMVDGNPMSYEPLFEPSGPGGGGQGGGAQGGAGAGSLPGAGGAGGGGGRGGRDPEHGVQVETPLARPLVVLVTPGRPPAVGARGKGGEFLRFEVGGRAGRGRGAAGGGLPWGAEERKAASGNVPRPASAMHQFLKGDSDEEEEGGGAAGAGAAARAESSEDEDPELIATYDRAQRLAAGVSRAGGGGGGEGAAAAAAVAGAAVALPWFGAPVEGGARARPPRTVSLATCTIHLVPPPPEGH